MYIINTGNINNINLRNGDISELKQGNTEFVMIGLDDSDTLSRDDNQYQQNEGKLLLPMTTFVKNKYITGRDNQSYK